MIALIGRYTCAALATYHRCAGTGTYA